MNNRGKSSYSGRGNSLLNRNLKRPINIRPTVKSRSAAAGVRSARHQMGRNTSYVRTSYHRPKNYARDFNDFVHLTSSLIRNSRYIVSSARDLYKGLAHLCAIYRNPYEKEAGTVARWPTPDYNLPIELLKPLDMSATIESIGLRRGTIGLTKFLMELGWKPSKFKWAEDTDINPLIGDIVAPIRGKLKGIEEWQTTSSKPDKTYKIVREKIDFAPRENHAHHKRLHATYRAIADHLRMGGTRIRRLTYGEVVKSVNDGQSKKSSVGSQERDIDYKSLGEYLNDPDVCKPRVEAFRQSLRNGKPINAYYKTSPKREKKTKNRGRLIWSLGGSARIHEAAVFGNADELLSKLVYTVFRLPTTEYGCELAAIMRHNMVAVCDDVSGWDTKVSYTMLCMEADFLCRMSDDEEHKRDIRDLYRLYAYPVVSIMREWRGETQEAFYQLQGQRASGTRVTYLMNTITNIVVTMCRAAVSQGVSEHDMYRWALDRLREGHSSKYGGKISGDDSVIVLGPDEAKLYATVGAKFMNEIGMPRKGLKNNEDSVVCYSMDQISFCSHSYALVKHSNSSYKWAPVRSITEIIAKAMISNRDLKNSDLDDAGWARSQGYDLLRKYPHLPTIRLLALAILSATLPNIMIKEEKRMKSLPDMQIVILLKPRTLVKKDIREQHDPLTSVPGDLDAWQQDLRKIVGRLRDRNKIYTDWIEGIEKPEGFGFGTLFSSLLDMLPRFPFFRT